MNRNSSTRFVDFSFFQHFFCICHSTHCQRNNWFRSVLFFEAIEFLVGSSWLNSFVCMRVCVCVCVCVQDFRFNGSAQSNAISFLFIGFPLMMMFLRNNLFYTIRSDISCCLIHSLHIYCCCYFIRYFFAWKTTAENKIELIFLLAQIGF